MLPALSSPNLTDASLINVEHRGKNTLRTTIRSNKSNPIFGELCSANTFADRMFPKAMPLSIDSVLFWSDPSKVSRSYVGPNAVFMTDFHSDWFRTVKSSTYQLM